MHKLIALISFFFSTLLFGQLAAANTNTNANASASGAQFSLERAQAHLNIIAQQPHVMGSAAHKQVQNYLKQELLQLAPQVNIQVNIQVGQIERQGRKPTTLGYVENIVAKIPGTAPQGKALLIMSHYDSQAHTFGAGDAGHGVAAILEALTVLKKSPPLKNDLIILFSDGEEIGLLGAQLFFKEHAWAKDVGMALNFEARGNSGPVFMFETSNNNRRMVEEFIHTVKQPEADSLFASIYRVMPNSTDFTVLAKQGISGLNFAPIGNQVAYHSMLDTAQNMSPRTLMQTGEHVLSLTQHFGNIALPLVAQENLTYFTLPGHVVVSYAVSTSLIIGGITLLLLCLCFFFYWKQNSEKAIKQSLISFKAFSATLVLAIALFVTLSALHKGIFSLAQLSTYEFFAQAGLIGLIVLCAFVVLYIQGVKFIGISNINLNANANENTMQWPWIVVWTLLVVLSAAYLAWGFVVIAILALITFALLILLKRYPHALSAEDFQFSSLLLWALVLILGMWKMPEAVHVLYWPLLVIACVALLIAFQPRLSKTIKHSLQWTSVFLVLCWWSFYIIQFHSALGIDSIGILSSIIMLLIMGLPALHRFLTHQFHRIIATVCLVAAGLLVGYTFGPANLSPLRTYDTFLYINTHDATAQWGSKQSGFPQWSGIEEMKIEGKENHQWNKIDPNSTATAIFSKKQSIVVEDTAKSAVFALIANTQNSNTQNGNKHSSHIKLQSPTGAELLDIFIEDAASITALSINHQVVDIKQSKDNWLNVKYYGNNPNGLDIQIEKNNNQPWKMHVNEVSFHQHPQIKQLMQARPALYIPSPYSLSDAVIMVSEFTVPSQ